MAMAILGTVLVIALAVAVWFVVEKRSAAPPPPAVSPP